MLSRWRRSAVLAMVGFSALGASACGDDDDDPKIVQNLGDADAGLGASDAGPALLEKVANVGSACSLLSRGTCMGEAAQCLEISYSGAFYAGGYCTADCKSNAECGPGGECPVAESEKLAPSYDFRSTWARKCFKSCDPDLPGACRAGYACMSLAEAYVAPDAPAPLQRKVCIPRLPTFGGDAGSKHGLSD